jgi:hypothetical protein
MFNSEELGQLRELQESAMPDTVTVLRITVQDDADHGGSIEQETTLETTHGRQEPTGLSPEEQTIAARAAGKITTNWILPYSSQAEDTDIVIAGGRRYLVLGVMRKSLATARRLVCVEVL